MVTHLMKTEGTSLGTAPPSERINCFSVKFIGEDHDEERKSHVSQQVQYV
jgi:asparagine synthase (glutamine-hydrolysing)